MPPACHARFELIVGAFIILALAADDVAGGDSAA